MDRNVYKSAFDNIEVSDKAVHEVIQKAAEISSPKRCRRKHRFGVPVPAVVLLSIMIITVSVSAATGLTDIFSRYFSQLLTTEDAEFDNYSTEFIEKNAAYDFAPYSQNGVTMSIEGIIGDRNFLLLKSKLTTEAGYDEGTLAAFMNPELYIGELKKGILPATCLSNTVDESRDPLVKSAAYLFNYDDVETLLGKTAAFDYDKETLSGKTATLVIKNSNAYEPVGIDLAEALKQSGEISIEGSDDPNALPLSKLSIPFSNDFRSSIVLKSVCFVNGKLVLVIDSSGYYENPSIYLRDKITNRIIYHCDGILSAGKGSLEFYAFDIGDTDKLENLEIVMPEEHHISFPLSFADNSKELDISGIDQSNIKGITVESVRISPLSLNIEGRIHDGTPIVAYKNCSIRFKDNSVVKYTANGYYHRKDGVYSTGVPFGKPLDTNLMDAVIIECDQSKLEIPIN